MFLKYRPVRVQDLPECSSCIRDSFIYDDNARAELMHLWRELICTGAANAAVMEDQFAPPGQRITWFCLKVFIEDDYAEYLRKEAPPFVGAQVLRSWRKGRSPLMTAAQVQHANSTEGVNILVLNSGAPRHMMTGDNLTMLAERVVDFSWYFSSGYRCKEMFEEFYDDFTCQWAQNAGFRLRTAYSRYYESHPEERRPEGERPYLYSVTAAEAHESAGTLASLIFRWKQPLFFFRPIEQELLLEALLGETDEDLARSLGVAMVTVRKRWDSIYDRVAAIRPAVLSSEWPSQSTCRSHEKKRRLLSYLRQHIEELRPIRQPVSPKHPPMPLVTPAERAEKP